MSTTDERIVEFKLELFRLLAAIQNANEDSDAWAEIEIGLDDLAINARSISNRLNR